MIPKFKELSLATVTKNRPFSSELRLGDNVRIIKIEIYEFTNTIEYTVQRLGEDKFWLITEDCLSSKTK